MCKLFFVLEKKRKERGEKQDRDEQRERRAGKRNIIDMHEILNLRLGYTSSRFGMVWDG